MTGAVIGAVILGILTSGFAFLNVDAKRASANAR